MARERFAHLLSENANYTQTSLPLEGVTFEPSLPVTTTPTPEMRRGADEIQRNLEEKIDRIHAERRAGMSILQNEDIYVWTPTRT